MVTELRIWIPKFICSNKICCKCLALFIEEVKLFTGTLLNVLTINTDTNSFINYRMSLRGLVISLPSVITVITVIRLHNSRRVFMI